MEKVKFGEKTPIQKIVAISFGIAMFGAVVSFFAAGSLERTPSEYDLLIQRQSEIEPLFKEAKRQSAFWSEKESAYREEREAIGKAITDWINEGL